MLESRWRNLCRDLGLAGAPGWDAIESAYTEQARAYHNLAHVADCLARLDEVGGFPGDRDAVELAIWFHDIVYDSRCTDNEEQSAQVAGRFLEGTGWGERVPDLIRATRHVVLPVDPEAMLLCDVDLSILGRDPAT